MHNLGDQEEVLIGDATLGGERERRSHVLMGVSINDEIRPGLWGEEELRYCGGIFKI